MNASSSDPHGNEAQIRALMNEWTEAVRAKDIEKLMVHYAPDVLVCDLMPPLHYVGAERYRQHCQDWFDSWQGPIQCERVDLNITAGEEVAFSSSLTHNSGVTKDSRKFDFWVRVTVGFRKIDGQWKVTHEHVSMPFDMETMQACMDLKP